MVGFLIELALVFLRQVAVVFGHVFLLVILQPLLALFKMRSLSRSQLAILHAIGDAVLLIGLALVDLIDPRMSGIDLIWSGARSVGLLRSGGTDEHQTTHCKNCKRLRDFIGHLGLNPGKEV